MKPIIFDTETTGTDHQTDQIIEAAWLELPERPYQFAALQPVELPHYHERFKPSVPISLGAQAVHHIICQDLVGCRESKEFALPAGPLLMIGHNVDFDWRMAGENPEIKRICTLALSRFLFPDKDSHTQSAMMYLIARRNGREAQARELLRNAHAALDDVRNCAIVLRFLLQVAMDAGHAADTWDDVHALSEKARIPTVMPYGKHKGTPINQVPGDYKAWLLRQPDVDPYLAQALRAR